mmetsp:Transcript_58082/g.138168  ORF Transcript_58082/g.138168 Transcript_58082/m.138168 type:complete len:273 (-) Transcript_58082:101-919(-)
MFLERSPKETSETAPVAVRMLVAGDAAVGKSSLVETICGVHRSAASAGEGTRKQGDWTCGCALSIHREVVEVNMRPVDVELEFWEIGGSRVYSAARSVFYEGIDAILLVYDVSNMKSYDNLVVWLFELCTSVGPPSLRYWDGGGGSGGLPDPDLENDGRCRLEHAILSTQCPVLFVANKCDLRMLTVQRRSLPRPSLPERPGLLERLLGGVGFATPSGSEADGRLMNRICDFIMQGRHTEASAKKRSFDVPLWRDFVRRTVESKLQLRQGEP